jgi:hypothetical protein
MLFFGPRFASQKVECAFLPLSEFRDVRSNSMSRHHMLPPLTYLPPQPKIEKPRRRRLRVGDLEETEEAAQATEASAVNQPASPGGAKPGLLPIEGSEHKPHHPQGRLSEGTLSVLLQAQESD